MDAVITGLKKLDGLKTGLKKLDGLKTGQRCIKSGQAGDEAFNPMLLNLFLYFVTNPTSSILKKIISRSTKIWLNKFHLSTYRKKSKPKVPQPIFFLRFFRKLGSHRKIFYPK